ncbi:hypothetical protein F4818DRAFT_237792 [Hypoxylon cercidicola]|nr:hypothetical protein F4818DRAFT_237792 [Hypoxylon cercidicola]
MFHKTVLLGLLLGALATAAPSHLQLQQRDACAADPAAGYCKTLTYADRTDGTATSTSDDCQNQCRAVLSDAGDWSVDFTGTGAGYIDEMVLEACQFGVSRASDTDTAQFSFDMHNQDILDVIGGAVNKFAGKHGGKIKADGTMDCSGHVVKWHVG